MNIDAISSGVVIDHITAGKGMMIYELLGLDRLDVSVALIRNVYSRKMGRKDIIKIDAELDINLDVIGFVDPGATVNFIKGGARIRKCQIAMPNRLTDVIKCKNPRCITTTEQELPQVFQLADKEAGIYRCLYCETRYQP